MILIRLFEKIGRAVLEVGRKTIEKLSSFSVVVIGGAALLILFFLVWITGDHPPDEVDL